MNTLIHDIKYAFRQLRKSPGFTAIALITLAIGIGANTIMFSVVNALVFRPVQVKESEKLVCCKIRNFGLFGMMSRNFGLFGMMSYSACQMIRDDSQVFSNLMVQDPGMEYVTLAHGQTARQVGRMFVSANYFSFLGVTPAFGRGFLPEEEHQNAPSVAVLSFRAWQQLGADPEMVGQHIRVNGVSCVVIGVAPEGFTGVTHLGPDLWLPLGSYLRVVRLSPGKKKHSKEAIDLVGDWYGYPEVVPVGRLKPGLSMSAAQAQLQALAPRLKEKYPRKWKANCSLYLHRLPRLAIFNDDLAGAWMAGISLVLMGVSAAVLLIACLNLAGMMIVQGARRHREIAVRLALGGSRLQIIRQLLIESLLLALLGGILGLLLAFWSTRVLNNWIADLQGPMDFGAALRVGLNVRVLLVTLGFCLIATILFGLRPALGLSRRDIVSELKESGGIMLQPFKRKRGRLSVVCQIALTVVLVMGAALFTRGAVKALRPSSDFSFNGKLLVKLDTFSAGYDSARSQQVYETLVERLRSFPGILAVSLSASFPFAGGGGGYGGIVREYVPGIENDKSRESRPPRRRVKGAPEVHKVGADYFEAMGMLLLQGRPLRRLDSVPDAEKVVIIDEQIARRLRPNDNALGCLITFGGEASPYRVVGIVPTLRIASDDDIPSPQIYLPMAADSPPTFIQIRVAETLHENEVALQEEIRTAIREIDPQLPILLLKSLADCYHYNPSVWMATISAKLAAIFGAMALFLASLGIYAVKGYMVASRTRDIGIRKALGATHRDIMGMVFREGLVLTITGLIVGLLLGLGTARLIRSMLYGIQPVDLVSIIVTVALLGVTSLLASYIPARRAAKIDPMEALRYE
ncbi:MAG: ADOP family duplicated permease [Planctomycetota bacterium]